MKEKIIFDRNLLKKHKDQALDNNHSNFLFHEVINHIIESLEDLNINFTNIININSMSYLNSEIKKLYPQSNIYDSNISSNYLNNIDNNKLLQFDEEFLPLQKGSVDLMIYNMGMHWINDVVGTLIQLNSALKKGGMIFIATFGEKTLEELRKVQLEYCRIYKKPFAPTVSPFIRLETYGSLLNRAGFSSPVISSDLIQVEYKDLLNIIKDIVNMGECTKLIHRDKRILTKNKIDQLNDIYVNIFSNTENELKVSFEINYITAWK